MVLVPSWLTATAAACLFVRLRVATVAFRLLVALAGV